MTQPWQSLSGREIQDLSHREVSPWIMHLIRKVEDTLRERNTPSPSPDFLAGWQAAFNTVLEEMQYFPPSKVGEARFFARLVFLKSQPGGLNYGVPCAPSPTCAVPETSHPRPPDKGD